MVKLLHMQELNIKEFEDLNNSALNSNKPLFLGFSYQSDK